MEKRKITLPLTKELAKTLHAGDQVLLTGTIYTSRDAGHKRMCVPQGLQPADVWMPMHRL